MARVDVVREIADRVGDDRLVIQELADGWPSLGLVMTPSGPVPVALFVSSVGLGGRQRDDVERRFQNPANGKPIATTADRVPLLLGLWTTDWLLDVRWPVIMAADARKREGLTTRFSVFGRPDELLRAAKDGWAAAPNGDGEVVTYLHPSLLPAYVEARAHGVDLPDRAVRDAAQAAGIPDLAYVDDEEFRAELEVAAADRVRRITSSLVRDARFAGAVRDAYQDRCAMCALGLGLVEAAHIYPASAPGSVDAVWNGIALCANHHGAFDRHLIWVDPADLALRLHPDFDIEAAQSWAAESFRLTTFETLAVPAYLPERPRREMFLKRYEYFAKYYDWIE